MPDGASHHFDGLQDPAGNVSDPNLNSLDAGGNVWPIANALKVSVEPAVFNSSALVAEVYPGAVDQVVAPSTTNFVYLVPGGPPTLVIDAIGFPGTEHCPLATVQTDGVQPILITDFRPKLSSLVGSGPPSGTASGVLAGTYPAPGFAAGAIVNADVNAAAAIVEAKLNLNNSTHANTNDPTTNQKAALAGTGTPGAGDLYVNNSDARMTDARTPSPHTASHQHGGGDEIATVTPAPNAIPKADGLGLLDPWVTAAAFGQNQQLQTGSARTTTVAGAGAPALKVQAILPAITGTVRVRWNCDVDNNGASNAGGVRLYNVSDAGVLDSHVYGQIAIPLDDAKHITGVVDFVLAGVAKTVELQHWDVAGGNTQGIARANVEVFRVF